MQRKCRHAVLAPACMLPFLQMIMHEDPHAPDGRERMQMAS